MAVGLLVAVAGGTIIGRAGLEGQVEDFARTAPVGGGEGGMTRAERLAFARHQVAGIVGRVWPYVPIGVGLGAAIHDWVPQQTVTALLGQDKPRAVPLATLIGMPIHADIFGTLSIAEAPVGKGVGPGTVPAFGMAVTALSPPSMSMLKRVVRLPPLLALAGAVTVTVTVTGGILIIGFTFNAITHRFI